MRYTFSAKTIGGNGLLTVYAIVNYSGPHYLNLQTHNWVLDLSLACLHEDEGFMKDLAGQFSGSFVEEYSVVDWNSYDRVED